MNPDSSQIALGSDRPTAEQLRAELERVTGKRRGRGFLRFLLVLLLLIGILAAAASVFLSSGWSAVRATASKCWMTGRYASTASVSPNPGLF